MMELHQQPPARPDSAYMSKFGEAIQERREVVGFKTATACAEASAALEREDPVNFKSFSQQTMSRWERDRTGGWIEGANPKALRTLAYLLDWSSAEFERHVGVPIGRVPRLEDDRGARRSSAVLVPVVDGREVPVYEDGTGPDWEDSLTPVDLIILPTDAYYGQDVVGLRATNDGMDPYLPRGAIAIVVIDEDEVVETVPGEMCAVWMGNDGVVIRRFVKELPDEQLLLEILNPEPGEERFFTAPPGSQIVGRVVSRLLEG